VYLKLKNKKIMDKKNIYFIKTLIKHRNYKKIALDALALKTGFSEESLNLFEQGPNFWKNSSQGEDSPFWMAIAIAYSIALNLDPFPLLKNGMAHRKKYIAFPLDSLKLTKFQVTWTHKGWTLIGFLLWSVIKAYG
jgi:hypothetical protein